MGFREVVVLSHDGKDYWESTLIRGALWYFGIPSRVLDYESFNEYVEDALCVILAAHQDKEAMFPFLQRFQGIIVLVGRNITLEYLQKTSLPAENEILIYGEPYVLITRLAKNQRLFNQLRGKAVLGPLLDPREYRTPPIITKQARWASIMTSIRCQKRCGYCSYGDTYSRLYPKGFARRSRPWQDVAREIINLMGKGTEHFLLLADQFLARNPEENQELHSLAWHWKSEEMGRPTLAFTVSPVEVLNNKPILEAISHSFHLCPRLSIDSLDNNTLALFDLDFDASTALKALKFLAYLKLPLRINYIFVRPGATIESIREEFSYFVSLAAAASYLTPQQKLLLAYDLFSGSLRIMRGAPIACKKGIRERYEEDLPPEFLKVISRVQNVMQKEINNLRPDNRGDPLLTIVEAGLKEVMSWS